MTNIAAYSQDYPPDLAGTPRAPERGDGDLAETASGMEIHAMDRREPAQDQESRCI